MMPRSRFVLSFLLLATTFAVAPLHAQQAPASTATTTESQSSVTAPANETPQQRLDRLGVNEDPGPDPDPNRVWVRFGKEYVIQKFPKKKAAFDQKAGWVRPMGNINIPAEIYREDETNVWVWLETAESQRRSLQAELDAVPEQYASGVPTVKLTDEDIANLKKARADYEIVTPPASPKTLVFEESSAGLPTTGSWRNSLAVGDMNEDGFVDLVAPPQRGSLGSFPSIFLGDGTGQWKLWTNAKWTISANYGSVAVGDLNKDGHMDVVLGIHLQGLRAFLGDGKGNFTDASVGLPQDFPTRRAILSDVNGDGALDIVTVTEGATPYQQVKITGPRLRAYLNDGRAGFWKLAPIADLKRQVGGDWLTAANLNGDKIPDFVSSSIFFSSPDTVYLSDGKRGWKEIGRGWLPFYSAYWAMTAGKFTSKKRDDVLISYMHSWPTSADPRIVEPPKVRNVLGIDRLSFAGKKPTSTPVIRWESKRAIWAMGSGDFDGDGNLDAVYWHPDPHELSFVLGDGKGNFSTPAVQGIKIPENTVYDLTVDDVNRDGKPDVIVMFETGSEQRDGSIRVYLNRGVQGAAN